MSQTRQGDSLETIEDYINKQYPSDISFTHRGGKICKFPPGHRIRIAKLIQMMKDFLKKANCQALLLETNDHMMR